MPKGLKDQTRRRERSTPVRDHHERGPARPSAPLRDVPPLITDYERAERLREVLQALYEVNKRVPVVVEGKRDVSALRRIGLIGDIVTLHGGKGLYEFCEDLAEHYHRVVLLMDWDEKGESLHRKVASHLKGHWEEFTPIRDIIKVLCRKDINELEGVPSLLVRLAGTEVTVGEPDEDDPFRGIIPGLV
ncbi:MAG TPA: toprim domain-containing protein [Dissulfurispiraceae bacterium]|nr:toprim domain-containing protein [Dissulfurispiraceae bacterium]